MVYVLDYFMALEVAGRYCYHLTHLTTGSQAAESSFIFYHKIICGGEVAKNPVETKNVAKNQTISTSLISWKQ